MGKDDESLEPFFNNRASEPDGTKRNIRTQGRWQYETSINEKAHSDY